MTGTGNVDAQADDHPHPSSHSHVHGPAPASSLRLRRLLAALTLPLLLANVIALAVMWPRGTQRAGRLSAPGVAPALIAATVTQVDIRPCSTANDQLTGADDCTGVTMELRGGPDRGTESTFVQASTTGIDLRRGDRIYVERLTLSNDDGSSRISYGFYEFQRERPILLLTGVFIVCALLIGRRHGVRALLALALSLGVLAKFMLPAILEGRSPLVVALVGASAVMFLALYLSHGVNVRTTTAVLGTVVSLAITGLLAKVAVDAAHFTGLADDDSVYVRATAGQIDLRGLLLAGIIIGALGVLDDVTVTQASAVWELHQANPDRGVWATFHAAMRIGRDHIASVVNTLVLAYAGAALPLLILFTQAGTPLGEVFNGEPVATEIVRMLAGSIGLMAAVPITTALTAFVVSFDARGASGGHDAGGPSRSTPARPWKPPKGERDFFDA